MTSASTRGRFCCCGFSKKLKNSLLHHPHSYTFNEVQANSDIHWKFQRYSLIVQYHSRPSLAPPFIIVSHLNLFIKRIIRKVPSIKIYDFGQLCYCAARSECDILNEQSSPPFSQWCS